VPTPEDLRRHFGDRVRALREAGGRSQEALAHDAGMHRTYLGGIERGRRNPSLLNIARLADALGVPLVELFEGL
jgi:transcriptional regulator with XRE-family HTH domain